MRKSRSSGSEGERGGNEPLYLEIMKNSLIAIIIGSFVMLGLTIEQKKSDALIPDKQMMQVGIIVEDIEKSAKAWASFLGNEEIPEISVATGSEKNPTKELLKN